VTGTPAPAPDRGPAAPPEAESVVDAVTAALAAAQAAADDLLLHLQLAHAASYGPTAIIDAAMADVAARADALARADDACRRAATPEGAGHPRRLTDLVEVAPEAGPVLDDAGRHLRETVQAVERQAQELALELARRRADIDEVLRHAAGSPGTYDASGRTTPGAPRRPRGTG
jgi:hypothetical protein